MMDQPRFLTCCGPKALLLHIVLVNQLGCFWISCHLHKSCFFFPLLNVQPYRSKSSFHKVLKFCKQGRKLCLQWSVFFSFQSIDQVSFIPQTTLQSQYLNRSFFFPFAVCDLLSEIDYVEMQQFVGLVLQNFLLFIFFNLQISGYLRI